MAVENAFSKLREQVKVCMQTPNEFASALQLIQNTNMDFFDEYQNSELFRLKGDTLLYMGKGDESNSAYCYALMISCKYGKAWLSWGIFCDRVYSLKKEKSWAGFATTCYLQAASTGYPKSRLWFTRVLWLLSQDDPVEMAICVSFKQEIGKVPCWNWLLWIPQLLSALGRKEGTSLMQLLQNIATTYPQALYYMARSQYTALSHRWEKACKQLVNGQKEGQNQSKEGLYRQESALLSMKTLMAIMHQNHNRTTSDLELMMDTIRERHRKNVLEEFIEGIDTLFMKYSKLLEMEELDVLDYLDTLYLKYFKPDTDEILKMRAEEQKTWKILGKYGQAWNNDFGPKPMPQYATEGLASRFGLQAQQAKQIWNSNASAEEITLILGVDLEFATEILNWIRVKSRAPVIELFQRLEAWQAHLRYLSDTLFRKESPCGGWLRFESSLDTLQFQPHLVEIPGQYWRYTEVTPYDHIFLEHFHSEIKVDSRIVTSSVRSIGFVGSDGKLYWWQVLNSLTHQTRSATLTTQMAVLLNKIFSIYSETRRRCLQLHVTISIQMCWQLQLVYTDVSYISLHQIYERHVASTGMGNYDLLHQFKKVDNDNKSRTEGWKSARIQIYKSICKRQHPNSVFEQYIARAILGHPSNSRGVRPMKQALWLLKTEFARHAAMQNFLSYIMKVGDRDLEKWHICRRSGVLKTLKYVLVYDDKNRLINKDEVPFRLTPNIEKFLSPWLVDGIFGASLIACAACLLKHSVPFKNYLYLYIRDDLLSRLCIKLKVLTEPEQRKLEQRLFKSNIIIDNANLILQNISSLMQADKKKQELFTKAVETLIEISVNKEKLAVMPAHWMPWF